MAFLVQKLIYTVNIFLISCNLTKTLDSITWQVMILLLQKVISYESLAVQTPWGAKQSSMNDEVLQIARQKPEENT